MAKYQQSSGVYGDTPFLYPLYGVSEINQAYSRLGAVHGAYFILSRAMDSLVVDGESGKIRGVVCSAGQFLEAPVVIMPTRFFPGATRSPQSSRFVAITEESLSSDDKLFHMIMPPTTAEDRTTQTVFLTQLDGSTYTCPRDRCMNHSPIFHFFFLDTNAVIWQMLCMLPLLLSNRLKRIYNVLSNRFFVCPRQRMPRSRRRCTRPFGLPINTVHLMMRYFQMVSASPLTCLLLS